MNPITIRDDILKAGRVEHDTSFPRRKRSAHKLIAEALFCLSLERASFGSFDKAKDAEIKEAIRLYFQTWVVPQLEEAYDKIKPKPSTPPTP